MATFYAQIGGKIFGPFDAEKLKSLAAAGKISPDDLISKNGKSDWVTARRVTGLFLPSELNVEQPGQPLPTQGIAQKIGGAMLGALGLVGKGVSSAAEATGKTLTQHINPGFMTRRRRVAITGFAGTGKTVFLTTLINHLLHHDLDAFHLNADKDVAIKQFTELEINDSVGKFDHWVYAKAMQTGQWPRKTVDVSAYLCRFKTDQHVVDHQLEFLDFPGERVADVVMYKRDYAEWSDRLLKYWEVADVNYQRHVTPYLAAMQQDGLREKSILFEYRLAMARLILDYNPLISPSCYLVGRDGNKLNGTTPEQLAETGVAGIGSESQFAPLTKEVRIRQPTLSATFEERYREYRKQVVDSLFHALKHCNRLIVLVDIPEILASGHNKLNDNHEMIDEMLKGLEARSGKARGIIKGLYNSLAPAEWMWTGIDKIAFVATKADIVGGQTNRDNLLKLLKEMLRTIAARIEGVEVGFFVASPVCSTQDPQDGSVLIGKPMFDEQGMRRPASAPAKSYSVSAVPERWPEHWSSGQYSFPDVYPALPQGRFMLPKHIHLDDVFRFILE